MNRFDAACRRVLAAALAFGAAAAGAAPARGDVAADVAAVVNLSGVPSTTLALTGRVLGDIYLGRIQRWNDPAIAALNPRLDLPSSRITVVHRADASATTARWTELLSRSNADWKAAVGAGDAPSWPVGDAANGDAGVASTVQRTRMSIGYVDVDYAQQHGLRLVTVRD